MANRIVGGWLLLNVIVLGLYTVVPSVFFNDGTTRLAGMPSMLLWFTILPVALPGIMALFYLWDRRTNRTAARRGSAAEEAAAASATSVGEVTR